MVDVMDNGWIKFLLDDEEAYVSGDYVDVEERLEKAVSITELLYGQGVSDAKVSLVQYAKTVHRQSLCMGRYEPYKRCRLFRFYNECL